jgi:hypothetical protein
VEIIKVDLMKSWMEVDNGRWNNFLVVEGERVSNENQKGEVNKIWMHVCLFKLLDICVAILLWHSCFNNMYFVSGPSHARQE